MALNPQFYVNAAELEKDLIELRDSAKSLSSRMEGMDGVVDGLELALEALRLREKPEPKAKSAEYVRFENLAAPNCKKDFCVFNVRERCRFYTVKGRPPARQVTTGFCEDMYREREVLCDV